MSDKMLEILQADHDRVRALVEALRRGHHDVSELSVEDVHALRREFLAHLRAEEAALYPLIAGHGQENRSVEDHAVTEVFLEELCSMEPSHPAWETRLLAFVEMVEHHFEEEERGAFELVSELMDADAGRIARARFVECKLSTLSSLAAG